MKVSDPRQDMPPEQWRPGVETRMLVSAGNGAAQLCIFEQWIAPGTGAPTHSHPVEEVLTVREGEAEMWMDEARVIVSAGQSLIVPAGRMHGFRNSGNAAASHPRGAGVAGVRGDGGGLRLGSRRWEACGRSCEARIVPTNEFRRVRFPFIAITADTPPASAVPRSTDVASCVSRTPPK